MDSVFGFVGANIEELSQEQKRRYNGIYCGICRNIHTQSGQAARLSLRYDMAFLALLLMSLYEPEELSGDNACILHPIKHKNWIQNEFTAYAADMNVALAYYKCLDDWADDKHICARAAAAALKGSARKIALRYPRQCRAIETCISDLRTLEEQGCPNADTTANCFGALMAELMVYREDLWAEDLRGLGYSLGRFIYLADAAMDYASDEKKKKYNPYLAMGTGPDWPRWEQYLVLAMARCTEFYERLPLVQDKPLLDNILYSGVWVELRKKQKEQTAPGGNT